MAESSLPSVLIGERVLWLGSGSGLPKGGVVKWIGRLPEMGPEWAVGLELDEPLPYGGIDGTWGRRKLFKCEHKHGLIVPLSSVIPQPKHKTGDTFRETFGRTSRCSSKNGSREYLAPPKTESKVGKLLRALSNDESSSRRRNEDLELPSTHLRNPNLERQLAILGTLRRSKLHDSGRLEGVKSEACLYSVILEKEEHVFRERQRMIHGRGFKRSDDRLDRTSSIHSSRSGGSRRDRSSGIFSIFRWFKREKSEDSENESPPLPSSPVLRRANGSLTGSVDTLFSTATTRSFAFVQPSHYRPYGGAHPPEIRICPGPETNTYRNRIRQRDVLREAEKHISLQEKYRLYASETLPRSVDRINEISEALNPASPTGSKNSTLRRKKRPAPPPPVEKNDSVSENSLPATLTTDDKNENDTGRQHRRTLSEPSPTRYTKPCHVKGKRRAPPPPEQVPQPGPSDRTLSLQRKKRRAPPPPIQRSPSDEITDIFRRAVEGFRGSDSSLNQLETASTASTVDISQAGIVATDTLKLERGYLKPAKDDKPMDLRYTPTSPVSPRPWYKRNAASRENSFSRSNDRKKEREKRRVEDWMIESGIPRKPNHLSENRFNIFARMDKTEEKRRSQISILTNISELDREAAEIVKKNKEKEQARLSNHNDQFYEEIGATSNGYFISHNDQSMSLISSYTPTNVTVNSPFFLKDGDFRKENRQKPSDDNKIHRTVVDEQVIRIVDEREPIITEPEPEQGPSGLNRIAKVTIEELDDFDKERNSKAQAIFEANKQQRHQSPFIPTIAEVSESAVASPASTVANTPSDPTLPPLPGPSSLSELKPLRIPASIPASVLKPVVHVVWNCPRCTLENPRWKITCDACDMWRPVPCDFKEVTPKHPLPLAVLRVVEPKDDPNLNGESKQDKLCAKSGMNNGSGNSRQSPDGGLNLDLKKKKTQRNSHGLTISDLLFNTQANVTPKDTTMHKDVLNGLDIVPNSPKARSNIFQRSPDSPEKPLNSTKVPNVTQPVASASGSSISSLSSTNSDRPNELQRSPKRDIVEPEEIRRARLEFFEKFGRAPTKANKLDETELNLPEFDELKSEGRREVEVDLDQKPDSAEMPLQAVSMANRNAVTTNVTPRNQRVLQPVQKLEEKTNDKQEAVRDWIAKACIPPYKATDTQIQPSPKGKTKIPHSKDDNTAKDSQTLTDIPYKPILSQNQEEDRKKLREMLIEMKHSLPKRAKEEKLNLHDSKEKIVETPTNNLNSVESMIKSPDPEKKLGAIRKIPTKPVENNYKHSPSDKAEAYLVESETIIEEIKMRKPPEKVSSAAQTSAVVKQITPQAKPPSGKEVVVPITVEEYTIKDGVLYTSVKKSAKRIGNGTFQLMRPRDFANIEAIKTNNSDQSPRVYANVSSIGNNNYENINPSNTKEVEQLSMELTEPQGLAHFRAGLENNNDTTHLNTIAVNRLLRRLESAIANGQHELAAALAKELAQLQVNCVVTRQKPESASSMIQVEMFVEDRENHQGPYPLKIKLAMTVEQLKLKVEREYEIPSDVQRWIIGKSLASDDKSTLESLGITESGAAIFLYLVAPETPGQNLTKRTQELEGAIGGVDPKSETVIVDEVVIKTQPERPPRRHHREEMELTIEEMTTPKNEGSSDMVPKKQTMLASDENQVDVAGWKCNRCTLLNSEDRPGCAACGSERPTNAEAPTGNDYPRLDEAQGPMAKNAEDDKKRDYQKLVDLEKADLIVCAEKFECPICMVDYNPNEGVVLRECLHVFCRPCLANTVEYSDEAEVKCPFRDDKYTCDSTLLEREIKALVTPEVYEQHLAKSIALAETKIGNAFHCKTPDCKGWCIFEDNVNLFRCPVCSRTNCLTCQAIHDGVDCKQFQEQLNQDSEINVEAKRTKEMLQEMVDRGEAMNCPTCQVVLMKKWGCDWLRCSMCKTEICWITRGPRWGPNGKGDTSGGCQCGVNGVKCHPKCTYCH